PLADQLSEALGVVVDAARAAGLTCTPAPLRPAVEPTRLSPTPIEAHHKEGSIIATATGGFARMAGGHPEPFTSTPKSQRPELRALVEIRDAMAVTLTAQAASADDTAYFFAQQRLNRAYDSYVQRFGPLNRY